MSDARLTAMRRCQLTVGPRVTHLGHTPPRKALEDRSIGVASRCGGSV